MCIDSYVINRFKTIVEVFLIIFLINVEIFVWDLSSSLIIRFMNRIYYGTAYSLDCREGHMKKKSLCVCVCVCIGVKRTSILENHNR